MKPTSRSSGSSRFPDWPRSRRGWPVASGGRVVFLTTELAPCYVTDDDLAVTPLRERGLEVSFLRWREPADWAAYDLVVVRSTWDYQDGLGEYLATLETIASATRLENPLALMRWNVRKTYLRDLAAAGIPVVPTVWRERLRPGELAGLFGEAGADELVVKPVVGSSGEDAFRVRSRDGAAEARLLPVFGERALMAQPFLTGVLEEGEWSVVWVDGRVSHALRKVPRAGEFRSQEEHGGRVERVEPPPALRLAADRVYAVVRARSPRTPLYGRADFLRDAAGDWLVGELELVEPSLYLRLDPEAPRRLADAVARRLITAAPGSLP